MHPSIVVMAKVPRRGRVKTRLAATLSAEHAHVLAEAFVRDKVRQLARVVDVSRAIAFTPPEGEDVMRALAGPDVRLLAQRGSDLGERLANVARDELARGAPGVLLVDADTPHLPPAILQDAVSRIAPGRVVLGPATDGGYYAIGLAAPCGALFEGITWSTPSVLAQTTEAAGRAGLAIDALPAFTDVDDEAGLRQLVREMRHIDPASTDYPTHTARALERIGWSLEG